MPVTKRFVLVLVLEFVGDVESILWTGLKSAFVPKGLNDSSLAVYCLGIQKKSKCPVREPRLIEDEDDDEYEDDLGSLRNIPDLLQDISTLI